MADAVASGETTTFVDEHGTTWYKRKVAENGLRVSVLEGQGTSWSQEITPAQHLEAAKQLRALDIGFEMTSTEMKETNKTGEIEEEKMSKLKDFVAGSDKQQAAGIRLVKHLSSGVATKMVDIEKN